MFVPPSGCDSYCRWRLACRSWSLLTSLDAVDDPGRIVVDTKQTERPGSGVAEGVRGVGGQRDHVPCPQRRRGGLLADQPGLHSALDDEQALDIGMVVRRRLVAR